MRLYKYDAVERPKSLERKILKWLKPPLCYYELSVSPVQIDFINQGALGDSTWKDVSQKIR